MFGLLGDALFGTNHLTGPTADQVEEPARFVRHELVRGKPVLQDLGDDAGVKRLSFFFDETFCTPEAELRTIRLAFQSRMPVRLFFDMSSFEVGTFRIERLAVQKKQITPTGRIVRLELEVDLVESATEIDALGAVAGYARAIVNPMLRRE